MQEQQVKASAVIVAAGTSRRMLGRDKLTTPLRGRSTIARTLDVFQVSSNIEAIVVVTSEDKVKDILDLSVRERWSKVIAVVAGGKRRQDSVTIGLDTLAKIMPACTWVVIHDAARPLVTQKLIHDGLLSAQVHQASTAAVPVKETIKQVKNNVISATLDRSQLWSIQTPQVFSFPLILNANHHPLAKEDVIDDAALLERLGYKVAIFQGSYANIKITTQEDIHLAESLLQGDVT